MGASPDSPLLTRLRSSCISSRFWRKYRRFGLCELRPRRRRRPGSRVGVAARPREPPRALRPQGVWRALPRPYLCRLWSCGSRKSWNPAASRRRSSALRGFRRGSRRRISNLRAVRRANPPGRRASLSRARGRRLSRFLSVMLAETSPDFFIANIPRTSATTPTPNPSSPIAGKRACDLSFFMISSSILARLKSFCFSAADRYFFQILRQFGRMFFKFQ